jgi:hypothetical protein
MAETGKQLQAPKSTFFRHLPAKADNRNRKQRAPQGFTLAFTAPRNPSQGLEDSQ